jgi:tRNA-specific 2-thiouridylase
VLDIEPVTRTVTVGPAESLDVTVIETGRPVWTGCPPPDGPVRCAVQLRAHGEAHPATATPAAGGRIQITLDTPARGVAPGQAAVLYDGDLVLGSATITQARRLAASPA